MQHAASEALEKNPGLRPVKVPTGRRHLTTMELEKEIVGLVTDHAVLKQKITRRGNRTKRHTKENCK